jgi:hypothetical protein
MALDSSNVRVAVTGEVLVGATSASAPSGTGGTTTGFTGLGYISEDGITESRDLTTDSITAFQNGDEVRRVITGSSLTYNFRLIEVNAATMQLFYGAAPSGGSVVVVPSSNGGRKSFIIDIVDGSELMRIYIPEGEVTEVGDVTYANGEAIGYEVTISCYPNTALGGSAEIFTTALS